MNYSVEHPSSAGEASWFGLVGEIVAVVRFNVSKNA